MPNLITFTEKLKNLLKTINSILDEWTTKNYYGKPIFNSNGKLPSLSIWFCKSVVL